jgi:hypothetical protein
MTDNSRLKIFRTIPSLRWWIGGLLFLSTVLNYIDRQTLSVLAPFLKNDYHRTNADFAVIGSQRNIILNDFIHILRQTGYLYLAFILLHIFGFLMGFKKDKIAVAIGLACMNNGMTFVLAAACLKPSILVLAILSELPWNTLLGPFRKIISRI